MPQPGIELATIKLPVQRPNHYTSEPSEVSRKGRGVTTEPPDIVSKQDEVHTTTLGMIQW